MLHVNEQYFAKINISVHILLAKNAFFITSMFNDKLILVTDVCIQFKLLRCALHD